MNSKRQSQISNEIQKEFSDVLLREANHIFPPNVLISITNVSVTPDLSIARIYFSIFNASKPDEIMETLNANHNELKRLLGRRIRNLRRVPELEFYMDDSLAQSHKMEEIFKSIKKDKDKEE